LCGEQRSTRWVLLHWCHLELKLTPLGYVIWLVMTSVREEKKGVQGVLDIKDFPCFRYYFSYTINLQREEIDEMIVMKMILL